MARSISNHPIIVSLVLRLRKQGHSNHKIAKRAKVSDHVVAKILAAAGIASCGKRGCPLDRNSLRARVLRELRSSAVPISTTDLALILCPGQTSPNQRVMSVLITAERKGLVQRHPPLERYGTSGPKRSVRWTWIHAN